MAKDVLITPLDGIIQFSSSAGAGTGQIKVDSDDLVISNLVGDVLLGDGASDVFIGNGSDNVDIVFEQNGEIRDDGSGKNITLGSKTTNVLISGSNTIALQKQGGNVGIGKTTATTTLEVEGDISGSGTGSFSHGSFTEKVGIGTTSPDGALHIVYSNNTGENSIANDFNPVGIQVENTHTDGAAVIRLRSSDADGYILYDDNGSNAGDFFFKTDGQDNASVLTLLDGGNVGIGTESPTKKLQVEGSISSSGAINTLSHITASGNISSSGTTTTNALNVFGPAGGSGQIYINDADNGLGVSDGLLIQKSGQNAFIYNRDTGHLEIGTNNKQQLHIRDEAAEGQLKIADGGIDVTGHITASGNISGSSTSTIQVGGNITTPQTGSFGEINLGDDKEIRLGDSGDLRIFHDPNNSVIREDGGGDLFLQGSAIRIRENSDGGTIALFTDGAGTELRHDNVKKFETSDGGINVTGHITASGNISSSGGLKIEGGSFNLGGNTVTDAAIVLPEGQKIYTFEDGQYFRNLIHKASDVIQIGQSGTALVDEIRLLPGNAGFTTFYGNTTEVARIDMAGNITASGNISASGFVSASSFSGDGAGLTNITSVGTLSTLTVDDITINGSQISDGGNLTIISTGGDVIIGSDEKQIDLQDGDGNTRFSFKTDSTPEMDVTGNFTIDGSGLIKLDSATNNIDLIGNVTASGNISSSATITANSASLSGKIDVAGRSKFGLTGNAQASHHFKGISGDTNFFLVFDKDGEEVMKGEGSVGGGDLKYTFGDNAVAGNGTLFQVDEANNKFILHNDANNSKVGINTTAPTKELTVKGDISASGLISAKQYQTYVCSFNDDMGTTEHGLPWGSTFENAFQADETVAFVVPCKTDVKHILMRGQGFDQNLVAGLGGAAPNIKFAVKTHSPHGTAITTEGNWTTKEVATVLAPSAVDTGGKTLTYARFSGSHAQGGDAVFIGMQFSADFSNGSDEFYITVVMEHDYNSLPVTGSSQRNLITGSIADGGGFGS
jgi:hypothetical protein